MRFMMIVKANKASEAGVMPSEKMLAAMAKYNEELVKAGIMLEGAGLHPSSKGVRVTYAGGKPKAIDGPFAETKELIAGYWLIQVKSKEEAIEWAKRIPYDPAEDPDGDAHVELRQLFELEDFEPSAAIDHHQRLQDELKKK